jgi:hypothetical protein
MRYTRKFLEARFRFAAEAMAWNTGPVWTKDAAGNNRSAVGAVFLERGPIGGWRISQIMNERGGEHCLTGNISASELVAWIDGVLYAKDFWQPTRKERAA